MKTEDVKNTLDRAIAETGVEHVQVVLLDNYYAPAELTERIREWVEYYNHQRYHEAIDNVTPADKYYGRDRVILKKREKVRNETMKMRRELNRMAMLEPFPNGVS